MTPPPRVMEIKTNVNKWDLIKFKSFFTAKETISKVKSPQMGENNSKWNNWQRINFQNIQAAHTTNARKTNNPIKKLEKDLNRHFCREDIQMANKHMKRCSASLVIQFSSVQSLSCLILCNRMNRSTPGLPCPSPTPRVYPNSCPSSWWYHPAISSSVVPFSCPQSLPASESFPMSHSLHEVAKVLEFQLYHQFFLWTPRTDFL